MTACYLSPIGNSTQTSTSGAPLAGGLIYTYQAGTATPQATYMDNSGSVGQANPIVLNTYGLPSNPIWLVGGQAYKFVIKDALGNTIRTIDSVNGIDDALAITADQKTRIPAFSAYQSVAQNMPQNTSTKLQFQTKEYDYTNAFDAATNFRFQPQIAGIYKVSGGFGVATSAASLELILYKNGSVARNLQFSPSAASSSLYGSADVVLNGSTDYIELWGFQSAAAQNLSASSASTYFQAVLVRAA